MDEETLRILNALVGSLERFGNAADDLSNAALDISDDIEALLKQEEEKQQGISWKEVK